MDAVDDLATKWRRIEGWLRSVLQHADLSERDNAIVAEYLDHNELGLAFEHMVEVLAERNRPVDPPDLEALGNASGDMEMGDNVAWKHLLRIRKST